MIVLVLFAIPVKVACSNLCCMIRNRIHIIGVPPPPPPGKFLPFLIVNMINAAVVTWAT